MLSFLFELLFLKVIWVSNVMVVKILILISVVVTADIFFTVRHSYSLYLKWWPIAHKGNNST